MAVGGFNSFLQAGASVDLFSGVLPFVISYVLFFFLLKKVPVFKDEDGNITDQRVPAIVAIAAAFYVARFVAVNPLYQDFFVQYFGTLTIGIIGVLGLLMLLGMMGWDLRSWDGEGEKSWIAALMGIIAIAAFTVSGGVLAFLPGQEAGGILASVSGAIAFTLESGLIWIIVVGAAMAWIMSAE